MRNLLIHARSATASAAVTNLLTVGLSLGSAVLVARALGAEGRGEFAALFSAFTIVMVIGELGQSAAVTFAAARDEASVASAVATGRRIMLVVTGVTAIATAAGAALLLSDDLGLLLAYLIALLGCVANAVGAPYMYATQATSFSSWNRLRIIQPVAYLALVATTFALGHLTVLTLAAALALSTALSLTAAVSFGRRRGMAGGPVTRERLRSMGRYGALAASAGVPISLGQNLDKILLVATTSTTFVGQYAVAATVAALGQPVATAIASVVLPKAARTTDRDELRALGNTAIRGALATSVGVSLALALVGTWLIPFVFGAEFDSSVLVMWLLLPGMVARAVNVVMTGLLRGVHRPGDAAAAQIVSAVAFLALLLPAELLLGPSGIGLALALAEMAGLAVALRAWRRRI